MLYRILPPEEYWENPTVYITLDATKTPVHALVTSILDFCNSLLYDLPANNLAKIQRLQNPCARVNTRTGRRTHTTPVLKLPVHRRIQYILTHIYRAIHNQSPVYLSDLLSVYRPTRSLRSTILLTVTRTRTVTYGDRTFTNATVTLWNSLPVN